MTRIDAENPTVPPDGRPQEVQPRWRQDFPVDWPRDEYITRREFTKFMVLTSLAFTAGQFWIVFQNALRGRRGELPIQPVARVEEIPVGGARLFTYPTAHDPRILVRLSEERFVAYDQQCTHLLCPVLPEPREGRLHCPCHEGSFDLETGRPLAGPPQRPLPRVLLKIDNGVIYATGMEESLA